ncbi:MAG TPA: sorbosone dehydrogenase family protein [Thermoanaerobaculia bacterium]|nr:sorbosone dehydrogenase family protein [Thermoanaerobaculia bacterium]
MKTKLALACIAILFLSCRAAAEQSAPPVVARPDNPLLKHYEVRADTLPPPFETKSSTNPPNVGARPKDAALHLPPGFKIEVWARDFDVPRNMIQAPNGDVIVAETDGGRITILRDANKDGVPEGRFTFASGLNEPFGLALGGNYLYVGNTDAVVRLPYRAGQTEAAGKPERIAALPTGGHSTRNVIFNRDGSKLYVAVGSRSNVSVETDEPKRAAITEMNPDGSGQRIFGSGLRNPVGLAWNPANGSLWTTVNERDGLGDNLVPDYVTDVRDGAFYGWPFSYIGKNEDPRRKGERPDLVAKAVVPSVLLESHSAALGIGFYDGTMFPARYRGGAFVALHGSWNRSRRTGYKVIHIPFSNGRPAGGYDDFVVGWAPDPASRIVWGRPVGILVLRDGSLLVSDDGANVIWRVTYEKRP